MPICHPIGLSPPERRHRADGVGGFAVSPGYELWLYKLVPCSELLLRL